MDASTKQRIWNDIKQNAPKTAENMRQGKSQVTEILRFHLSEFPNCDRWEIRDIEYS